MASSKTTQSVKLKEGDTGFVIAWKIHESLVTMIKAIQIIPVRIGAAQDAGLASSEETYTVISERDGSLTKDRHWITTRRNVFLTYDSAYAALGSALVDLMKRLEKERGK